MARGRSASSIQALIHNARALRSQGMIRKAPPIRPGLGHGHRLRSRVVMHGRKGGFFSSVFKGIKKVVSTVSHVPVVGTVAKAALGSLPLVSAVKTAANTVKSLTATAASPTINFPHVTATPGPQMIPTTTAPKHRRKKAKKSKAHKRTKRTKRAKAKRVSRKHGSAKQRAARARFARAARKGRIKKGSHLK